MGWDGPMTCRQYLAWQAWLDLQWDRPNRTDQYIMQCAYETRLGNVKHPRRVKFEAFRLKFIRRSKPAKLTEEERKKKMQAEKALWVGLVSGVKPNPKRPSGSSQDQGLKDQE